MKITKQALKRIITEEIKSALKEGPIGDDEWKQWQRDITGVRGARLAGEKVSDDQRDKWGNVPAQHHADRSRDTARSISDIFTGEEKVYVLDRGRDYEGRTVVGVYSSEELAKKGIESDIEAWRASGRLSQPPSPEEYDIQEFELDD